MRILTFSELLFIGLCITFLQAAYGQDKLPNKQAASVWVPGDYKIDGKANEWNNRYQANNSNTDILYTIANNNEDLYFIVHANTPQLVRKIVERGVTFTIKKLGTTDSDKSFTFPANGGTRSIDFTLKPEKGRINLDNRKGDTTARDLDSIMKRNNRVLAEKHKWIQVEGVKGVDSLVAIYNEHGIRAVGQFDVNKDYTVEIAIPLKLLGYDANSAADIKYQLKVNGTKPVKVTEERVINRENLTREEIERTVAVVDGFFNKTSGATYFDGEYILAKKP